MASDFRVRVGLDVAPSAEEIKKDIPKLQALLNKDPNSRLRLIAELDLEKTQKAIKSQLNKITVPNIKLGVDIDKNIPQINPDVSTKHIDSLPAKIAIYRKQLDLAKQSWAEQGYNIQSISNQFAKLGSRLGSITKETTFDRWVNDFNELNAQVRGLETNLNRQISIQNEIYKIQTKIKTLDPNKNISEIAYYEDQLKAQNDTLTNLKTQATVYSNLLPLAEQENYITEQTAKAREKLALTTAKMADKQNGKLNIVSPKDVVNVESVSINVEILRNRINALRKANPKAEKEFGHLFDRMLEDLDTAPEKIKEVSKQLREVQTRMKATGKTGNTFFGTIKANMEKFAGWMSMTGVITEAWHGMKQMVTEVKNINTEMINLQKVTDETDATYAKFLRNATKEAQKLSASVTDVIEQTSTWSKLGYSLSDAEKLSEVSMIYSKVGEVDNTTAVSDLVTVMKAFNIESENSIHIVDSLNQLGNSFATDAKSLGEGLTKSASALNAANNSFEQSIALLTGGTEITQNAAEMGSALKVISMRIRGKIYASI